MPLAIDSIRRRNGDMEDFGLLEMQNMQIRLHDQYKDRWEPVCPKQGRDMMLWLMAELGEVIDIIKKDGDAKIMENSSVRAHFVEEMADVLMYFNDIMLCYDISVDELKTAYREKHEENMGRWK